jgi:hypothetical protein
MDSPTLLTLFEPCSRAGFWGRDWEYGKIDIHELLLAGIRAGVLSSRADFPVVAGEEIVAISARREIASRQFDIYSEVIHVAAIAEIVTSAIRKPLEPPWSLAEPVSLPNGQTWHSGAFLAPDGLKLRRVAISSNWSDDRHYSFARSWFSLGESAVQNLPLQQATILLGAHRDGRFHGYWSKGLRHPVNKGLRFRKKNDVGTGFKNTWQTIFREDYDDIPTETWLSTMYSDGVLGDVAFNVDVPLPSREVQDQIVDLAARRLDKLWRMKELPDQNLSTCFWPTRCPFIGPCHAGEKEPNKRYGFWPISALT